jgi:hypothetical protein
MKGRMMRRLQRLAIALTGLSLICALMVFLNGKSQQRSAILELLKQEHITVQFTDGECCESIDDAQQRNWLFDTVDVVYFDVQNGGSSKEFLPLLERLPTLSRVIIRYQGDDFEEFRLHRKMIWETLAEESSVVAQAFPNLEVLNCWGVGEF